MNRFIIYRSLLLLIWCISVENTMAQQHDANVLKAAKVLRLNLDSITKNVEPGSAIIEKKGQKLTIRIDRNGKIQHIGLPLFNQQIRVLQPSPIYDYLEYAVLDQKYHISENNLQLQQLKFRKGEWKELQNITDTLRCTINNVEDKFYEVTWSDNEKEIVSVSFPINYELLANSKRKDILEKFVNSLQQYEASSRYSRKMDSTKLKPFEKKGIYVQVGDSYTIPSINTNTYFRKSQSTNDSCGYEWLLDKNFPCETLANRLLSPGSFPDNPAMMVTCFLYNHRKVTIPTTLANWMGLCSEGGCTPYYGFEKNNQGKLTATLIMRNRDSGYDHILTITCQQEQLEGNALQLEAKAYLYTPSSNVSDLFYEPSKPSQKKKIILK